ncbi:hypothetical protein DSO57_1003197 [Entomophthora muscae]|uniref:Uncharacterized protein n=1 Tax=Entomophthora muscae TaxID=34485 RepID=A0ACC2SAM5_9FUNG|nr:hypothetical protein DSO57_1003197 [Entomophthora muscae]
MRRLIFYLVGLGLGVKYKDKRLDGISYREYLWEINYIHSKSYRGFVLENKLEVLLISDPFPRKASASLVVSSGSHDDPGDAPGLAHFCEHMMHMGSAKYPNGSEYANYLNDNGGDFSATTYYNHTSYQFQVNPDALDGALDIFASLFIEPAMNKGSIDREINAVQAEYEYRQKELPYKVNQVLSAVLNSTHPYARFSIGNVNTLTSQDTPQLHDRVRDHYKKHYSANLMKLVVISPNLLEEMEKMVIPRFSQVPNFNRQPGNSTMPFQQEDLAVDIYMNPNMYTNQMVIQFIMPPIHSIAHQMAFDYISYYLTRGDTNSLLDMQVKKGHVDWIHAKLSEQYTDFAIYQITIALVDTPDVDQITTDMFSYLHAIASQGLRKDRYTEYRNITASKQAATPTPQKALTVKLAESMHLGIPIYNVTLNHGGILPLSHSAISQALAMFDPSCMRRVIISSAVQASQHEPWFNSNYSVSPMDKPIVEDEPKTQLPTINHKATKKPAVPAPYAFSLLHNDSTLRLWQIAGPPTFEPNRLSLALADVKNKVTDLELVRIALLSRIAWKKISKIQGKLLSVGEDINMHYFKNKLVIQIQAFRLYSSLGKILYALKTMRVSPDDFNRAKKHSFKLLARFKARSPSQQAHYMAMSAIQWDEVPIDALNHTLTQIDLLPFQRWLKIFLGCHQIDALLVGQENTSSIRDVIKQFQVDFNDCPTQFKPTGEIILTGETIYRANSSSKHNSGVTVYLDLYSNSDIPSRALGALTINLIKSRFKNKIRTQEQLGYMIEAMSLKRSGGGGVAFVVQSAKQPEYLESRIEAFLVEFVATVSAMPREVFLATRQAFLYDREAKNPSLLEIQTLHWPTILTEELNFQRGKCWVDKADVAAEQENRFLASVTQEVLVGFMNRTLIKGNRRRKKLSIQVRLPNRSEVTLAAPRDSDAIVTDLKFWKKKSLENSN